MAVFVKNCRISKEAVWTVDMIWDVMTRGM